MKNLALIAVLAALTLGATVAGAKDSFSSAAALQTLARTPAAELPATAAKLINAAPKQEQAAFVGALMRKVARTHPVALRHVVAAVAKSDPSLATVAAASAAKASPESLVLVTSAACSAAPGKAAEILAINSRVASVKSASLAASVADLNPVFSAEVLTRQAASVNVTADADVITGGNVITPIIPPGSIGQNLNFEEVLVAPTPIGPGTPGFDPDRYGSAQ